MRSSNGHGSRSRDLAHVKSCPIDRRVRVCARARACSLSLSILPFPTNSHGKRAFPVVVCAKNEQVLDEPIELFERWVFVVGRVVVVCRGWACLVPASGSSDVRDGAENGTNRSSARTLFFCNPNSGRFLCQLTFGQFSASCYMECGCGIGSAMWRDAHAVNAFFLFAFRWRWSLDCFVTMRFFLVEALLAATAL